ncbi:membrane-anchored ubiquitin-fold protein 3-like [Pyrus ussuriensis x Pyrus communis]|uniref:Membrane-anchored ubiquitin-fold protein 3-like n=1 Tax=Pyrus ussuriensis x Pyrus communis TaxID=2448454 RepID=A0A5N5GNP9_9ROSA|nr:membrane-anchored ubiquitin-fold protein 3-like [Pyrus ussuriensis x Pyrus communis]
MWTRASPAHLASTTSASLAYPAVYGALAHTTSTSTPVKPTLNQSTMAPSHAIQILGVTLSLNDLKLINAGKILENNRTLADSRNPVGELPGGLITMHVVVRPPITDKKNDKLINDSPEQPRCSCSIL